MSHSLIEWMVAKLSGEAGSPLNWDRTERASRGVAELIVAEVVQELDEAAVTTIGRLIREVDYRLVAQYLHARRQGPPEVTELCSRLAVVPPEDRDEVRCQLALASFLGTKTPTRLREVDDLSSVFDATDSGITAFVYDPTFLGPLEALVGRLGAGLGSFIEEQPEVPGPNARVRQGVVRSCHLPGIGRVAVKRANPQKPGRFRREQLAYRELLGRLGINGGQSVRLPADAVLGPLSVSVVPVKAVLHDGATNQVYAISSWITRPTLEQLLILEQQRQARRRLLGNYRRVLDLLFDRGVYWGDMSPRNIIVSPTSEGADFHLLDFEKTAIGTPRPQLAARRAHCRGQIGVEELLVLCDLEEVVACLDNYWQPAEWDVASTEQPTFPLRPEVCAVLRSRGVNDPTLGEFNRTDLQFLRVRSPRTDDRTGRRSYPGTIGFQVEHYLSCAGDPEADDYDRMTTEVLIAASEQYCLDQVAETLAEVTALVEADYVVAEFDQLLHGRFGGVIPPPWESIRSMKALIRAMYDARFEPGELQNHSDLMRERGS